MRNLTKQKEKGFTLVEIIVSLGLFGIIVAISIGSLISLFDANAKAQALSSVVNNVNYSMENMARIIRFADDYHCGSASPYSQYAVPLSCPAGDTTFAVSTSTNPVVFRWNGISKIEMSYDGTNFIPITSDEVTISRARFFIFNTTTAGNFDQPYVLINIRGYAGKKPSAQSSFDIQTVVSQRKLDI